MVKAVFLNQLKHGFQTLKASHGRLDSGTCHKRAVHAFDYRGKDPIGGFGGRDRVNCSQRGFQVTRNPSLHKIGYFINKFTSPPKPTPGRNFKLFGPPPITQLCLHGCMTDRDEFLGSNPTATALSGLPRHEMTSAVNVALNKHSNSNSNWPSLRGGPLDTRGGAIFFFYYLFKFVQQIVPPPPKKFVLTTHEKKN